MAEEKDFEERVAEIATRVLEERLRELEEERLDRLVVARRIVELEGEIRALREATEARFWGLEKAFEELKDSIWAAFREHKEAMQSAFQEHKEAIQSAFQEHKEAVQAAFREHREAVQAAFQEHKEAIQSAFQEHKEAINARIDSVNARIDALEKVIEEMGRSMDMRFRVLLWAVGLLYPFIFGILALLIKLLIGG